jgi:APA family basic amino acid/polyamine antiporter
VAQDLLGSAGSTVMSLGIALAMVSSTSSMLLVGPRVYAEMARDGFLPAFLRGAQGKPPRASIALQAGLAILLLHLHTIGELLSNVAGILVVFASLVGVGLFVARWRAPHLPAPRRQSLLAAAIYVLSSLWMLYNAFKAKTGLLPWLLAVVLAGLAAYAVTAARKSRVAVSP